MNLKLLKETKSNFPPGACPKNLQTFLHALYEDIVNAPLNRVHPNLPNCEREGGEQLVGAQRSREITVKPADKSGEICVMNTEDYISVINTDLAATYMGPDGTALPYYERVDPNILVTILEDAKSLVDEGVEKGFIHPSDGLLMIPSDPKPGRYYGLPKLQKPRDSWPVRQNIPPLWPIVSGSGWTR